MTFLAVVLAAVLQFIVVTTLDGREVRINPRHIVSISEARDERDPRKQLTAKVNCVLTLTNGNLITVADDCTIVNKRLEELKTRQ